MRKIIKKIATVVASLTMVSAMGISAFAADSYSFVGNPNLFGEADEGNTVVGWVPTNEDQIMTAVEGVDGLYTFTGNCVVAGDKEFKVLADATDMAWNFQMCIGNPDAAWADNQSQFRGTFEVGEYKVYVQPAKGFVCVIQNQKAIPMTVRFHSRDEDSANFVDITKDAIVADGYSEGDVNLDDAAYKQFVDECVVREGGTAEPDTTKSEETTKNEETKKSDETTKNEETTKAPADKNEDSEDEDDGMSPVVIVVIVVAVVAVIAIVVALTKKKK